MNQKGINMIETEFPKLHFIYDYDERLAFETQARGHLGGIEVELSDGTRHPVFFYDVVHLAQDLEEETKLGRPLVAEKGMIVVNDITLTNMTVAVCFLARHGFFGTESKTKDAN